MMKTLAFLFPVLLLVSLVGGAIAAEPPADLPNLHLQAPSHVISEIDAGPVSFPINITNDGTSPVSNVVLKLLASQANSIEAAATTPGNASCVQNNIAQVTCTFPEVQSSASVSVTVGYEPPTSWVHLELTYPPGGYQRTTVTINDGRTVWLPITTRPFLSQ